MASPLDAPPAPSPLDIAPAAALSPSQPPPPRPPAVRKRKKPDGADSPPAPSEPRRLRRSHEACARCRSKKIKCDSKHPRCTACATANSACHQEDRIRQTLTPRGHTEHLEQLLTQCDALLRRYDPAFNLAHIADVLARAGIDVANAPPPPGMLYAQSPPSPTPFACPPPPPGHMLPPGYPIPYGGVPYLPGPFTPHIHPAFHHPVPALPAASSARPFDVPGQDPQANDLSNTESLCKNFGVSESIVNDFRLGSANTDKEDLAVGSSGLTSGRDRDIAEASTPREPSKWLAVSVRRNSNPSSMLAIGPIRSSANIQVWLPSDRKMVARVVDIYFARLNIHRPVFIRQVFEKTLADLYDGRMIPHDPGFCCSLYLILALGTLSDLNHRATELDQDVDSRPDLGPVLARQLMPADWPDYDEFFERALAVKPDLRVTISSVQALILLHWYLYTERQGRTLWRLVGSLVRLSVELGLHHDPTTQRGTFNEEECQLRICLWAIVMIHDRGTSILLGRPLAIAPTDSSTPSPVYPPPKRDFSEHFGFSSPIADIQADIINSLYTPKQQTGRSIMRHAIRIIRSMAEFRRKLPDSYSFYFNRHDDLSLEQKSKIVAGITEDQGLTLLKLGIARILLFRAMFNAKDLVWASRHKALSDAVVTSHNIIVIHKQLIKFPDIAFFTSPIPLHIAAMIILYGHMSNCDRLSKQVALEDISLALDMLPRFRWRWERKDVKGSHPLLANLAGRVMDVDLHNVKPPVQPVLLTDEEWDSYETVLQTVKSNQSTPTLSTASYPSPTGTAPPFSLQPGAHNGGPGTGTPPDKQLVDVPSALFYPFFPESQTSIPNEQQHSPTSPVVANGIPSGSSNARPTAPAVSQRADFRNLLAAASPHLPGSYGYQASHDSFMSEERDTHFAAQQHPQGMQMWVNTAGLNANANLPPSRRGPTYSLRPT